MTTHETCGASLRLLEIVRERFEHRRTAPASSRPDDSELAAGEDGPAGVPDSWQSVEQCLPSSFARKGDRKSRSGFVGGRPPFRREPVSMGAIRYPRINSATTLSFRRHHRDEDGESVLGSR